MKTLKTTKYAKSFPEKKPFTGRYTFGKHHEYEVVIADTLELRHRAWALVHRNYKEKGYAGAGGDELWYGLHDALPDTRTFIVTREGRDVAALTLVVDSPVKLPADELYGMELDQRRKNGQRFCEIISLASEEKSSARCLEILKHLFRLSYLSARYVENATDLIITVNPHHTGYYEKKMLFEQVGEERKCAKVGGAPAVLLRLDLTTAEARYSQRLYGRKTEFYNFFLADNSLSLNFLNAPNLRMTYDQWQECFYIRRSFLSKASTWIQAHIRRMLTESAEFADCDEQRAMVG